MTGSLVPLYSYPTDGTWATVIAAKEANPSVPIVAIINPDSGPGAQSDFNYVAGILNLQTAGITVLGYVHTSYGSRDSATCVSEMQDYKEWYHVNGIFFDEMGTASNLAAYYQVLANAAASYGFTVTIGNPGTLTSLTGIFTALVTYENLGLPTSFVTGQDSAIIAYGVPSISAQILQNFSVGYIYITDATGNPYDVLPTYFAEEVGYLGYVAPPPVITPPPVVVPPAVVPPVVPPPVVVPPTVYPPSVLPPAPVVTPPTPLVSPPLPTAPAPMDPSLTPLTPPPSKNYLVAAEIGVTAAVTLLLAYFAKLI